MEQKLAELFLIGQLSVRLVMGRLLHVEDEEMQICKDKGIQLLSYMEAPEEVIENYAALLIPLREDTPVDISDETQEAERNLGLFLNSLARWCESDGGEGGIKTFNLGFCLFMAIFYSNLVLTNRKKFLSPLKEAAHTVLKLAQDLAFDTSDISDAISMLEKNQNEQGFEKINDRFTKFFLVTLKHLGGIHLVDKLGLKNW